MPVFSVITFILWVAALRGWSCEHVELGIVLPNGTLKCSVHTELLEVIFTDEMRSTKVMKLKHSLYGIKHAALTDHDLFNYQLTYAGLT